MEGGSCEEAGLGSSLEGSICFKKGPWDEMSGGHRAVPVEEGWGAMLVGGMP